MGLKKDKPGGVIHVTASCADSDSPRAAHGDIGVTVTLPAGHVTYTGHPEVCSATDRPSAGDAAGNIAGGERGGGVADPRINMGRDETGSCNADPRKNAVRGETDGGGRASGMKRSGEGNVSEYKFAGQLKDQLRRALVQLLQRLTEVSCYILLLWLISPPCITR